MGYFVFDFIDRFPDKPGDFWHDGVSDGFNSVCPIGNPIRCSAKEGFSATTKEGSISPIRFEHKRRATRPPLSNLANIEAFERSRHSDAGGVGNNIESVPLVIRANCGSGYAVPDTIIPEAGQSPDVLPKGGGALFSGSLINSWPEDRGNLLHENPSRREDANG